MNGPVHVGKEDKEVKQCYYVTKLPHTSCVLSCSLGYCIFGSLGPRPPPFYLPFAFTIIDGSRRLRNIHHVNDVRWTRGGRRGEGPNFQNNAHDHPFECSTAFTDSRP